MFDFFMLFSAIGVIITLGMKYLNRTELSWCEFGFVIAVNSVLLLILSVVGFHSQTTDTQILNGFVLEKSRDKVSCEHSYSCNCRQVSCGKNCTSTKCDTCYEHSHDFEYNVKTSAGKIKIRTEDRQGVKIPSRFETVQIGEPVSLESSFTNYIKAAPESLFNIAYLNDSENRLPEYPRVFDYYRVNRVILDEGVGDNQDFRKFNDMLNTSLKTLGMKKEVNIVTVFTYKDKNFFEHLKGYWLGGKQNDVIVVIGLDKSDPTKISWSNSFSFSKSDLVNVKLSHNIRDLVELDVDKLHDVITHDVDNHFERMSMKEFEYLMDRIDPPTWAIVIAMLISIGFSLGLSVLFSRRGIDLCSTSNIRFR